MQENKTDISMEEHETPEKQPSKWAREIADSMFNMDEALPILHHMDHGVTMHINDEEMWCLKYEIARQIDIATTE